MRIRSGGGLLKTKIVATIGQRRGGGTDEIFDVSGNPIDGSVETGELLGMMIEAGADVFRLNMSFAALGDSYGETQAEVLRWLDANKNAAARHVAVLGDLPGPKIRLHVFGGGNQELDEGEKFLLDFRGEHRFAPNEKGARVLVSGEPLEANAKVDGFERIGDYLRNCGHEAVFSVADGKILLAAESESGGLVRCRASQSGAVRDGQGLTIKRARIDCPAFGAQDKKALEFLLENGGATVAFVSVSFVKNKNDILEVRRHAENFLMNRHSLATAEEARKIAPAIFAKIETLDAWENIDEILDVADGVMVARGDLGLQCDPPRIPAMQKELIRQCNLRGKPVITATQMLDSMERNFDPTRAETTDVFNAILDGTDAVMLSGETAAGKYPFRSIEMMASIAEAAENYYFENLHAARFRELSNEVGASKDAMLKRLAAAAAAKTGARNVDRTAADWEREFYVELLVNAETQAVTDRISRQAFALSEDGDEAAILALTASGRSARMMSRFRPRPPIVGVAYSDAEARRLILSFGVYSMALDESFKTTADELLAAAANEAKNQNYIFGFPDFVLLQTGDQIIAVCGTPPRAAGATNLLQIYRVS